MRINPSETAGLRIFFYPRLWIELVSSEHDPRRNSSWPMNLEPCESGQTGGVAEGSYSFKIVFRSLEL